MENAVHPTREELDRYRNRSARPEELLRVDRHLAACERCLDVAGGATPGAIVSIAAAAEEPFHLTYEEMERFVDGRASGAELEIIEDHLADCTPCRDEVSDLEKTAAAIAPSIEERVDSSWRLPLAAAAMLAVAFVAVWFSLDDRQSAPPVPVPPVAAQPVDPPPAPATVRKPAVLAVLLSGEDRLRGEQRAAAFRLRNPVGTLVRERRPRFEWTALGGASSYRVTVVDTESQSVAARGSTRETTWQPSTPLEPGRVYTWQVSAERAGERVIEPRPPAPEARFGVASDETIARLRELEQRLTNDPRALGIALAEEGILDEAEEKLEGVAPSLHEQVRSWRR